MCPFLHWLLGSSKPHPSKFINPHIQSPVILLPFNVPTLIFLSSFVQFSSVQSLSRVWLFETPRTAACQASLSITNSWSLLKLMSIESVMPSFVIFFKNLKIDLQFTYHTIRLPYCTIQWFLVYLQSCVTISLAFCFCLAMWPMGP